MATAEFDYASPLPPYPSHNIAYGCFDRFNNGEYSNEKQGPRSIKVEKLSEANTNSKAFVSYDITITVEDVTQWSAYKNGKKTATYTADSKNPKTNPRLSSMSVGSAGLTSTTSTSQFVLDNKSYFTGRFTSGEPLPKRMPGTNTFSIDKKGETIGSIRIRVLVFKDMETAKRFVGRYNPIN